MLSDPIDANTPPPVASTNRGFDPHPATAATAEPPAGAPALRRFQTALAARPALPDVLAEANRIAAASELDDLLEQMLDLMVYVAGGSNGTFYLYDPDSDELIFSVIHGSPEDRELTGTRIPAHKGIVGAVVKERRSIVIDDLPADRRWYRELHPELSARLHNAVTLPLLALNRPIGAVQIFNFQWVDLQLLELMANRMASEVEKAVLLEKSRSTNRRLQTLAETLAEITSTLDRPALLQALTRCAARLVDAQSSSVFLVDSGRDDTAQWLSHSSLTNLSPAANTGEGGLPGEGGPGAIFSAAGGAAAGAPVLGAMDLAPSHARFQAGSTLSAPMRSRQLVVGAEKRFHPARTIGNLIALNKLDGAFSAEDARFLEILAGHAGTVLQITNVLNASSGLFLEFIQTLADAVDAKEPYTRGHSTRVTTYAVEIGRRLDLPPQTLAEIRIGGLLHDIGKLGVPDAILGKPGTLSDDEFDEIKKHPGKGLKMLEPVRALRAILPAVVEHHERLDGSGYPHGLYGDQISLMGCIIAVADVFDALTTDRAYRKAMALADVLDFFEQNKFQRFNAACVDALTRYVKEKDSQFYLVD